MSPGREMAVASLATMRVRRACIDALDARARAEELAKKVRAVGGADAPRLRSEAHAAWREYQAAERTVRELSVADILEAAGGRAGRAAPRTTPGVQLTFDEMVDVVQRVAEGKTYAELAQKLGRHPNTIYEHMRRWSAGKGRAARRAQELGIWPSGRKS